MGWSSRDNSLRKSTPTPAPKPVTTPTVKKEEVKIIPLSNDTTDLSQLDERSAKNVATLHLKVQQVFQNWILECQVLAKAFGYEYKAISGNRTWDEQAKLYAQGRTAPGKIVTNAKPGYSNHNFGLAVDMGVFKNGKYLDDSSPNEADSFHSKAAEIAKKYNLEWGGNWKSIKDTPHFEYKIGKTLAELRSLIQEGKDIFS